MDSMKHLKERMHNDVLTLNVEGATVLEMTEASQRLLDVAAQADAEEGIRRGLEDERNGRVKPARELFAEFERTHQIPAYQAYPPSGDALPRPLP
jgi:hypothetical protein